jgi:hypothetical protein
VSLLDRIKELFGGGRAAADSGSIATLGAVAATEDSRDAGADSASGSDSGAFGGDGGGSGGGDSGGGS